MAAVETITTVLTAATAAAPAGPYDLTDLATVKDELGIPTSDTTRDAFLSRAITQVSAAIASYCNRVFAVETVQDLVYPERDAYPYQVPGGVAPLQLSRWPIVAVAWVSIVDPPGVITTLSEAPAWPGNQAPGLPGYFQSDLARGWLIRLDPYTGYPTSWCPVQTTAVYQAGYSPIPSDLADATLRLVTQRYQSRGRDPMVRSQDQPGLGNTTYWVGSPPGVKGAFPQEIAAMLDLYRVPVTA